MDEPRMTTDELPEPALTIGTKLLPYEERLFKYPGMATKLGYTHNQSHYYSADQMRAAVLAEREKMRRLIADGHTTLDDAAAAIRGA